MAQIGGMRSDLLDEFPTERRDFIQMALILFTTGMMAAISGAFAIHMAFATPIFGTDGNLTGLDGPSIGVLMVCGLVWGFIIFNIDRYMVLGMEGLHRWAIVMPFLIRFSLALLIGLVMSTPLVLQIFSSDIENEMHTIRVEGYNTTLSEVQELTKAYDELQAKVAAQQQVVTAVGSGSTLSENPAYQAALDAYTKASGDCADARRKVVLERRGQLPVRDGGSGTFGDGDVYRTLRQNANALCKVADAANAELTRVGGSAIVPKDEVEARVKREQAILLQLTSQRDGVAAQLAHAQDEAAGQKGSWGLLIRLEALGRLTHFGSPAATTVSAPTDPSGSDSTNYAAAGHLAVLALLAAIEILPVLFKSLKQWNPQPTAYECRWRDLDNAVLARTRLTEEHQRATLAQASYTPVAVAAETRRLQEDVGRQMAQEVVGVQLRLMQQELQRWATAHDVPYQPGNLEQSAGPTQSTEPPGGGEAAPGPPPAAPQPSSDEPEADERDAFHRRWDSDPTS